MKREEILELVKQYYAEQFAQKAFEPGTLIFSLKKTEISRYVCK